jgi:hypothetical protein
MMGTLLPGPLRIVLLYSTTTYHFSSLFNVSTKQQQQLVDRTTAARERPFLWGRESSTSWRSTGVELAASHACFSVKRLGGRGLATIYSYQLRILRLPLSWFLRCQAPKPNRISWVQTVWEICFRTLRLEEHSFSGEDSCAFRATQGLASLHSCKHSRESGSTFGQNDFWGREVVDEAQYCILVDSGGRSIIILGVQNIFLFYFIYNHI